MNRHWKLLILPAAVLVAIAGAGKLVALAVMTALLPVYALLLISTFMICFIILASVIVPIGQRIRENRETAATHTVEEPAEEHRKAA